MQILVIDDGSTDDTTDVLSRIHDPRLEVIRTENHGVSAAQNIGLELSKGEFIAFLDADDRWLPTKIEQQLEVMQSEPDLVAVFTNFVRFNAQGIFPADQFSFFPELANVATSPTAGGGRKILGDAFSELVIFTEIPAWVQTMLFRASAIAGTTFAQLEGTDRARRVELCEDMHFCLRVFRLGAVGFLEQPLVEVRRHGSNITSNAADMAHAKLAGLELLCAEDLSLRQLRALRRRLGKGHIEAGLQDAQDGKAGAAARAYLRALGFSGARLSALKNIALLPYRITQK